MSHLRCIVTILFGFPLASCVHCSGCMKTKHESRPVSLYRANSRALNVRKFKRAKALAQACAILSIGCGSVTQVPPDVSAPPSIRGEAPQIDARGNQIVPEVSTSDAVSDGGGQSDSGERADGGARTDEVLPVCPPHLTCAEGKLNNCLCPVCVERYECNLQGSCRCADGGR
jgi:hypothetical protein